ncbi:MAG: hypothetical protein ABJA82_12875 [Myxococcales bacterium]
MNIVIPPLIFYIVGAALVVGGTVRALTLGRRNPDREINDDDPARTRARRRHFTFGLVWVGMGLFLIISTVGVLRSKWGARDGAGNSPPAPAAPTAGTTDPRAQPRLLPGPTLRLEPAAPPAATGAAPAAP